ncbi:hypothetical protein J7E88_27300 [Streptomyces sp. ISL-10]|uniref:hypothetical protein n=1 Tax=Streptomyces sp. ISL-10 TaxID=2819172 RepID=UPI001BEA3CD7|nr:hypothetical protein [Streptomyces sp. ISL-10]MBT2368921.1 hypothetical protein [Streptomyces sp. ISL-10]
MEFSGEEFGGVDDRLATDLVGAQEVLDQQAVLQGEDPVDGRSRVRSPTWAESRCRDRAAPGC